MPRKKVVQTATGESTVNKSQAIKDALAATPDKPPKQIAEELIAQGVDVNAAYVSTIKTNLKTAGLRKKPGKKKVAGKKRAAAATSATSSATGITFEQLRMAKDLAQQLGGVEQAREALGALSQLRE